MNEFEILKNIATYFTLVPLDRRPDLLRELIRIIQPPRELLQSIANELPATPPKPPAPPEEPTPRRVVVGTVFRDFR